jgi:hypothetical protein
VTQALLLVAGLAALGGCHARARYSGPEPMVPPDEWTTGEAYSLGGFRPGMGIGDAVDLARKNTLVVTVAEACAPQDICLEARTREACDLPPNQACDSFVRLDFRNDRLVAIGRLFAELDHLFPCDALAEAALEKWGKPDVDRVIGQMHQGYATDSFYRQARYATRIELEWTLPKGRVSYRNHPTGCSLSVRATPPGP